MGAKVYTGTFSFTEAVASAKQTMKTIALTKRTRISSIWIDGINTTAGWIAHLWVKIDGATTREVAAYSYTASAGEGVNLLINGPIEETTEVVIKLQSLKVGGGAVDVPYSIPYDDSIENLQSVFNNTGEADDVDVSFRSIQIVNDGGPACLIQGSTYGMQVSGSTGGVWIYGTGESNAFGLKIDGDGTGKGCEITSESANALHIAVSIIGHAIYGYADGANKRALHLEADNDDAVRFVTASGRALYMYSGAGVAWKVESADADAVEFAAGGNGAGCLMRGAGAGKDIDAAEITAIYNKLPSKSYLTGTANSDGDVEINESTGDFNATQQARINTEVDVALNTAIPGAPTADSINERLKAIDDKLPSKGYLVGTVNSDGDVQIDESTGDFNATQQARINTEVDVVLDTATPETPTANSIYERVQAIDDKLPSKAYLVGTVNADGDVQQNETTGDFNPTQLLNFSTLTTTLLNNLKEIMRVLRAKFIGKIK